MQLRRLVEGAVVALALAAPAAHPAWSQEAAPAAPAPATAPTPAVPQAPKFPPTDPKNFTATSPTKAAVEGFLKTSWGYDNDRVWEVFAIQTTPATGVSKVTVFVAQKSNPQQIASLVFYVTPDGKHLISNEVLPFGEHPYEEARSILQARADGPSRGAADKKFEIVEFADFQCPHCKAAQPTVEKLLQDFPNAHFVFQNLPLTSLHSEAYKAATYGVCVAQQGGNDAFFKFADAVFAAQENLTPSTSDATLSDAVTKAGLDPAKVSACATTAGKGPVDASIKLSQDLDVNETPMLFVNGRQIPIGEVPSQLPYETLKHIVEYQFSLDK
jgi:protein-disulfide isomerase